MTSEYTLGGLRGLLAKGPSRENWTAISDLLCLWPKRDYHKPVAINYAISHLQEWPDEFRVATSFNQPNPLLSACTTVDFKIKHRVDTKLKLSNFFFANQQIQRATLVNYPLRTFEPMALAKNLQHLSLHPTGRCGANFSTKHSLGAFANLRVLELGRAVYPNFTPFAAIENLHTLYINQCESLHVLDDLNCIPKLKNLRLTQSFCSGDYLNFGHAPNLEILELTGFRFLNDLTPMRALENLKSLGISQSALGGINGIEQLANLSALYIKRCDFSGFPRGLQPMPNLKHLVVYACWQMHSLQGIEMFPNLETLDLRGCANLSYLGSIIGLKKLKHLRLQPIPPESYRSFAHYHEALKKDLPNVQIEF